MDLSSYFHIKYNRFFAADSQIIFLVSFDNTQFDIVRNLSTKIFIPNNQHHSIFQN